MKRLRKNHGSALVFAIGVLFAASTVLLASAAVGMASNQRMEREFQDAEQTALVEGIQNYLKAKAANDQLTVPSVSTVAFGTKSVSVTLGTGPNDRWFNARGSATIKGRAITFNTNLSRMARPHPLSFTLFTDGKLESAGTLAVNGALSSVYAKADLDVPASSRMDGDVWATTFDSPYEVRGNKREIQNAINFTNPSSSDYATGARISPLLLSTMVITEPLLGTDPYEQYYISGNATVILPVLMASRTTIYVDGNLTINTSLAYANQASRWVFIVNGNLVVNASGLQGVYYVTGNVHFRSGVTATKCAIAAKGKVTFDSGASITPDRSLFVTRFEAVRHKIPGFWPVADSGIMR